MMRPRFRLELPKGFKGISVARNLGPALFLAALTFLAVCYGVIAQTYKLWPSGLLQKAQMGFLVVLGETSEEPTMLRHKWVVHVSPGGDGVVRQAEGKAFPGYTLYTSLHEPGAVLVDMDGGIVHRWRVGDSDLRGKLGVKGEFLTGMAYADQVRLTPEGDLWVLVRTFDTVSNGGGLVRLDRDSRVTWAYAANVHHDFDLGEDGTVYVLTNGTTTVQPERSHHLSGFAILDFIDVVSKDGELLKRISLLDCFADSAYKDYLRFEELTPRKHDADLFHANAVRLVGHDDFAAVPDNGHRHALVSMRTPQVVAVIDLDAEEVVHVMRGPWVRQHDPDILPDGSLLLFDNLGRIGSKSRSRVIRFEPDSGEILWQWPEGPGQTLDSYIRGSQQRLPNGNVLITESQGARLVEVNRAGEVVWEYRSPFRYREDDRYRFVIRAGQRFQSAPWLEAAGKDSAAQR